jgi:hypothetical protein
MKGMTVPKVLRRLAGGVPLREAYESEDRFFRSNVHVAGMATADGAVILNPYSILTPKQREAVALNEASRVVMAREPEMRPMFELSAEQALAFADYGTIDDIRSTIAGRLLSGDSSALSPTAEQLRFVWRLAQFMQVPAICWAQSQ